MMYDIETHHLTHHAEVERLRNLNARYKLALEELANWEGTPRAIARRALGK